MKVEEVPQDKGIIGDYGREICYAVGRNGSYLLSPSLGWEAKNIVNDQAWEVIIEEAARMHALVKAGKISPIAYYQAKHQMDVGLLSQYVNMARWRVKRHLKPAVFDKLPSRILQRYADVFSLTITELQTVPLTFSAEDIHKQ
jgi:hypothetical protein